jgi:asparagine synthase (glutamine-hydrolysing)
MGMSGIAGIWYLDGRHVEAVKLDQMVDCLAERGPDGSGAWRAGSVGLGHRMLWTTPESLHDHQPLVSQDGELAVTADVRIDNRKELMALFDLKESESSPITDSELILAAYEKWGEGCANKLIGDFAFAIWDGKNRRLFAARDPMGLKPLYYYYLPGRIMVFASEILAMFRLPEVRCQLNERRLALHLGFVFEDRQSTFYQDIFQLPAAHYLNIDADGFQVSRYWDLDTSRELRLANDDAFAEAFLEVFTEAVRCRLRTAYPVGSLLSGGLDSSSIVTVAREVLLEEGSQRSLHTFSAIFPTLAESYPRIDERPWIETVVAQGGLIPHYVEADRLDPLEAITFDEGEPIPVPNMWLDWGCFEAAHKAGMRVVLSGYDGDTAVSYGFGYLAELARRFHWKTLLDEARIMARDLNWPMKRVIKEHVLKLLVPASALQTWQKIRGRNPPSHFPFDPVINPSFAEKVGLVETVQALQNENMRNLKSARDYHRYALFSGLLLYGPEILEKAASSWSLEVRLPYFDRRLLEFLVAIPIGQKYNHGWNRYIVRRAMQDRLPSKVQWRDDKGNLSPNIRRGLFEHRARLDQLILHEAELIEPYVDQAKLHSAYERFLSQPMRATDQDIFSILAAATLARWLCTSRRMESVNL